MEYLILDTDTEAHKITGTDYCVELILSPEDYTGSLNFLVKMDSFLRM